MLNIFLILNESTVEKISHFYMYNLVVDEHAMTFLMLHTEGSMTALRMEVDAGQTNDDDCIFRVTQAPFHFSSQVTRTFRR